LFKFVLDYKIKELKREVEPRAAEIEEMKKETVRIDKKLKDLNLVNNTLIIFVDQLDEKQSHMQEMTQKKLQEIQIQKTKRKNILDDIYKVVKKVSFPQLNYNNFKQNDDLKKGIIEMYKRYVKKQRQKPDLDNDIKKEYENQVKYLEKSYNMLVKNLQKDTDIHKKDNQRIMRENVELIREINNLRDEVNKIKSGDQSKKGNNFRTGKNKRKHS